VGDESCRFILTPYYSFGNPLPIILLAHKREREAEMENKNDNYNPYLNRSSRPLDYRDSTYSWIIAAVLAVAIILGILYFNYNARLAVEHVPPAASPATQVITTAPQSGH